MGIFTREASGLGLRTRSDSSAGSALGEGCRIDGTARFEGSIRIDGSFEGSVDVGEALVIGAAGSFTGEIRAHTVVVRGTVRGTILAAHSVELQRGARVEGDVHTRVLVVEEGVFFQGHCRMEEAADGEDGLRLPKLRPAGAAPERPRLEASGTGPPSRSTEAGSSVA